MEQERQPTLWEKMSIFVITGIVVLLAFVCQWLFGMLYPQDSYREYTNWEIQELTTDNLLTRERLNDLAKVIDRKGKKTLWVDRINRLAFGSSGKLIGADLEFLTIDDEGHGQRYSFTITEGREQARLIRLQGYETVESTEDMVPYSAMYTLTGHPMEELANQIPIANQSQFWIVGLSEALCDTIAEQDVLRGQPEQYDWLVRAEPLRLSGTEGKTGAPQENTWFVRSENGWFAVSDWSQVSPSYLALEILAYHGDTQDTGVLAEHYGMILLED